jgi:hypothetical protein
MVGTPWVCLACRLAIFKVFKPAVPQYGVALGSEGNTGTGTMRRIRCGAWGQLRLMGHVVETVAGRL